MTPAALSILEFSIWSAMTAGLVTLLYLGYREAATLHARQERERAEALRVGDWSRVAATSAGPKVVAFGQGVGGTTAAAANDRQLRLDLDLPHAA
jgi:hypothetical protein